MGLLVGGTTATSSIASECHRYFWKAHLFNPRSD